MRQTACTGDSPWLNGRARCLGLWGILALLHTAPIQAKLPDLRIPHSFGVNIHQLIDPERELEMMHEAGFRIVRVDLTWESVEKNVGNYNFEHYDTLFGQIRSFGLRPLVVLSYSNGLYEPQVAPSDAKPGAQTKAAGPSHVATVNAFSRFVNAAVSRYKALDPIWEIWNEPDLPGFWPPEPVPQQYVQLAIQACEAIRSVDSTATVIAPGAAKKPSRAQPRPPFLVETLSSQLVKCIDGLSIHPYLNLREIDSTVDLWRQVGTLAQSTSPRAANQLDLVSSEWGLSTFNGKISDQSQASYLVQMLLLNLASGVRGSVIYDWRDDGTDPKNPEHHFGVTYPNLDKKPAWHALKELSGRLDGFSVVCAQIGDPVVVLLQNVITDEKYIAAWEANAKLLPSGQLYLPEGFEISEAKSLFGSSVPIQFYKAQVLLKGPEQPFYARLKKMPPQFCMK